MIIDDTVEEVFTSSDPTYGPSEGEVEEPCGFPVGVPYDPVGVPYEDWGNAVGVPYEDWGNAVGVPEPADPPVHYAKYVVDQYNSLIDPEPTTVCDCTLSIVEDDDVVDSEEIVESKNPVETCPKVTTVRDANVKMMNVVEFEDDQGNAHVCSIDDYQHMLDTRSYKFQQLASEGASPFDHLEAAVKMCTEAYMYMYDHVADHTSNGEYRMNVHKFCTQRVFRLHPYEVIPAREAEDMYHLNSLQRTVLTEVDGIGLELVALPTSGKNVWIASSDVLRTSNLYATEMAQLFCAAAYSDLYSKYQCNTLIGSAFLKEVTAVWDMYIAATVKPDASALLDISQLDTNMEGRVDDDARVLVVGDSKIGSETFDYLPPVDELKVVGTQLIHTDRIVTTIVKNDQNNLRSNH